MPQFGLFSYPRNRLSRPVTNRKGLESTQASLQGNRHSFDHEKNGAGRPSLGSLARYSDRRANGDRRVPDRENHLDK
jgi:hypothetical protein